MVLKKLIFFHIFQLIAIDLLKKMLAKDPGVRITAKEALLHQWIKKHNVQKHQIPFEEADNDITDENDKSISVHEKIKILQQEYFS